MNRSCGECAKLRTPLCSRPDQCVLHQYADFAVAYPWKKCTACGGRMIRIRTRPMSDTFVITDLQCSLCGLKAEERREYVGK